MGLNTSIVGASKRLGSLICAAVVVVVWGAGDMGAQTRTERFFDDWKVLCVENADGDKQCSMNQTLVQTNPRREVFRWTILVDQQKQLTNVLSAPLGVALKPGLELTLGESEPISVPYEVCGRRWCQARLPMSDDIWSRMASGEAVNAVYVNRRGQRLRLEPTVRGFREAIDYLQSQIGS